MKVAVVCGSAACMWDDLDALQCMLKKDDEIVRCALNVCGVFLPRMDQWFVTGYGTAKPLADMRRACRPTDCGYDAVHVPGHSYYPKTLDEMKFWPIETKGTVAMFAVRVLSSLEFHRIVLAGVPLDDKSGYFYGSPHERFGMSKDSVAFWGEWGPQLVHRVRSMSGRTEKLLGRPTRAWLDGGHDEV